MLFERIESEGIAHYSYLIGEGTAAVVIDPRRDCNIYIERAAADGMRITTVLETHRNEDYVIGSVGLAVKTGARILHADAGHAYGYGEAAKDGDIVHAGKLTLRAIHTPGHTLGSMSWLLSDPDGKAWMLFCGDVLFAGDVGRVDLMGMDRARELSSLLFDSIFKTILPLGDHILLCPAHGSGSVCAADIAERTWTTVGIERLFNPKLKFTDRDAFITEVAKELERPPYFAMMERLNLEGAPAAFSPLVGAPLSPAEFEDRMEGAIILDTRMELSFCSGHIRGALSIWEAGLPSFGGWFLDYGKPILLVTEADDSTRAVEYLVRLGFDRVEGVLAGGMLSWHMAGKNSARIGTVTAEDLSCSLDEKTPAGKKPFILDVRSGKELETAGRISGAHHIHLTQIPGRFDEIPRDHPIFVFCGSGLRSTIVASLLAQRGYDDLTVVLGGLAGWRSASCPVIR